MERSIPLRKLALLCLLDAPDPHGHPAVAVSGMTRLQKLLYLLWQDLGRVSPTRVIHFDLSFQPEQFGPADLNLYQDLEFLEALGYVRRLRHAQAGEHELPSVTDADVIDFHDLIGSPVASPGRRVEEATEDDLNFDYLMGDETVAADYAAAEQDDPAFEITPSGQKLLARVEDGADEPTRKLIAKVRDAAGKVKRAYGDWALERLLKHVYATYPDMTTASTIRNRVLGRP